MKNENRENFSVREDLSISTTSHKPLYTKLQLPKATPYTLRSNVAEHYIAYKLSKYCLVRPTITGTDIGIDLYCEIIEKDLPHLHFWVQVKTIENFNEKKKMRLEVKALKYWEKQPIPVFLFVINVINDKFNAKEIYVLNITKYLVESKIKNKQYKHIKKREMTSLNLCKDKEIKKFLFEQVPETYALKMIAKGVIASIPKIKRVYEEEISSKHSSKFIKEILEVIRRNTAYTLLDILKSGKRIKEIDLLTSILKCFDEYGDKHYEIYYALGEKMIYFKENLEEAKEYYEKSLECINIDKNINKRTLYWCRKIEEIEKKIEKIKVKR